MGLIKRKKCRHCKRLFIPDARNAKRQNFCSRPACQKASKADSQRRWLQKPENQDYFSGPDHVERVRRWRKANPGYWRNKRNNKQDALQDALIGQPIENKADNSKDALQDFLITHPPVLIGLIANFTGHALQDDIVMTLQRLQKLGQDIVNNSRHNKGGHYGIQGSHRHRTHPKSSQTIQLDRSPSGP